MFGQRKKFDNPWGSIILSSGSYTVWLICSDVKLVNKDYFLIIIMNRAQFTLLNICIITISPFIVIAVCVGNLLLVGSG